MAIILPLLFFTFSCLDWGSWASNVTSEGWGKIFVIGLFFCSFLLAGMSGNVEKT